MTDFLAARARQRLWRFAPLLPVVAFAAWHFELLIDTSRWFANVNVVPDNTPDNLMTIFYCESCGVKAALAHLLSMLPQVLPEMPQIHNRPLQLAPFFQILKNALRTIQVTSIMFLLIGPKQVHRFLSANQEEPIVVTDDNKRDEKTTPPTDRTPYWVKWADDNRYRLMGLSFFLGNLILQAIFKTGFIDIYYGKLHVTPFLPPNRIPSTDDLRRAFVELGVIRPDA